MNFKKIMGQKSNFTKVDNLLIEHANDLNITDQGFRLIVRVMKYGFNKSMPYPSNEEVAKVMGKDKRTIIRISNELQNKGFLKKPKGGS